MTGAAVGSLPLERWREVLAAVDRALELAPAERAAFLERCSTDDPVLGAEVEALLASAEVGSALDGSAAAFAGPLLADLAPEPDPVTAEARIGPYRVVATIGRGGMGAVYLAERADDQYRKRVALKLLPGWSAGDEHRVRRFLDERQILAGLEHPDIARLLDGGITPDGLPWFAMEYVEGVPIDRHCDERGLPIERRLDLFRRVCAAVQYAHRNLVVHRDLKPSNILVSGDGAVKLLDFGIAKLLGGEAASRPAELTQPDERIMTPLYASPEQIRGDPISTASDVYALGVLLYQLLTGRHPWRLSTYQPHDVARAILEQEPERPSVAVLHAGGVPGRDLPSATPEQVATARGSTPAKLGRRLRGDLDAIVLKAMEKDPRHRYGSAEQLEADARRYLAGVPVAARPANRRYLARKFLRRHRLGVSATAGVAMLVLGFTAITMVQSVRIRRQSEEIAAERDRAEGMVRSLSTVFRQSVPSPAEGRGVTSREVLDSSAALVERDLSVQPGTRARLLLEMGRVYHELGVGDRARDLLEASVVLWRRSAEDPREFASTLGALGAVLLERGELEGAERAYQEALALRRNTLGARHSDVARTLNGLAAVRLAQRRFPEAEALSRSALTIDRRQTGDSRVDVAESLRGVARARLAAGDYAEAARLFAEALSLLREGLPEEHRDIAGTTLDLATALRGKGEIAVADSLLRYGLALQRRVAATAALTLSPDSAWLRVLAAPAPSLPPGRSFASKIAFVSDRHGPDPVGHLGHNEIYVMNPDGSDQRRLTHTDGRIRFPAISPDGSRIAFVTFEGDLFVIDAGGGEPVRVTNMAPTGVRASPATWSPDGKRLAFSTRGEIYVINVDGTGLRKLTNRPKEDGWPAWSPRGGKIAFVSRRDGVPDLYVMNDDGTGPGRLTFNAALNPSGWSIRPAWSPDGRKIVFSSDRDGNREIYLISADGSGLTKLTDNPAEDGSPSWSPDGRQIAFHRRVLGHGQIFVMNADGSAATRLTEPSPVSFNAFPSWGPAPPKRPGEARAPTR
ncbi:MAG: protein kinase domain-containing protein [Gemmatimonadales bacterium]